MSRLTTLELLSGYRASNLITLRNIHGLDPQLRIKEEVVSALATHFSDPDRIKEAIAHLDAQKRKIMDYMRLAEGTIERDTLRMILVSDGIAAKEKPSEGPRYSPYHKPPTANPQKKNPTDFVDIVASLEATGLLLGTGTPDLATVVDFGIAMDYHVPAEVWPHLPVVTLPVSDEAPTFEHIALGNAEQFSRELFVIWSYIWHNQPTLLKSGLISKRDLKALAAQLPRDLAVGSGRSEDDFPKLYLQRQLLDVLGMIQSDYEDVLRVDQAAARAQWALRIEARVAQWLASYQEASWWSDMRQVEAMGAVRWTSSEGKEVTDGQLDARRWLLDQIKALGNDQWQRLSDLLSIIRLRNRSFLIRREMRSSYNYYSFGSQNDHRYTRYQNPMGWDFQGVTSEEDGWLKIERNFVRHLLTVLFWFGIVDLGLDGAGQVAGFRLTEVGRHLFKGAPPPAPPDPDSWRLVLQPNFHLVAFGPVPEEGLLTLEMFADRLSADRAVEYQISKESVYRGQQLGLTGEQILAHLRRVSATDLPQNVVRSLAEWQAGHERITIHPQVQLLQLADEAQLDTLIEAAGEGVLRKVGATVALVLDDGAVSAALEAAEWGAITTHDAQGAGSLRLAEDGTVLLHHATADLYTLGQLQRLAEPDGAGGWRLSRAAVRRVQDEGGLSSEAQIEQWRTLVIGPLPAWVEPRIKSWGGYFGSAKLHTVRLLEVKDKEVQREIRSHPQLRKALSAFQPQGVLLELASDADVQEIERLLADFGIALEGDG